MSLCDTRKAMKMGATNVEKRSLKTKHLAPIFRADITTQRHKDGKVRQENKRVGLCERLRGAQGNLCRVGETLWASKIICPIRPIRLIYLVRM